MTNTILVIDDDEAILILVADVLSDSGCDIRTYNNPRKAMEWVRGNSAASMAIVDLMMPEFNGEQVIAELHNDDRYTHTPILLLTAAPDGLKISERIGATGYIKKPFDINGLRHEVRRWLSQV